MYKLNPYAFSSYEITNEQKLICLWSLETLDFEIEIDCVRYDHSGPDPDFDYWEY